MNTLAKHFKVLSDPTRLRLLSLLSLGECCVCDLMQVLDLPQSTVSRHLATLRDAGWVHGKRQGQWMVYRLADPAPLADFLSSLPARLAALPEAEKDKQALMVLMSEKSASPSCFVAPVN